MLITNRFEIPQPVDAVWRFFEDIPQVAACLPGTELTDDLGDDKYRGGVAIHMGPVKLQFDGNAAIVERDETSHRIVVDAEGADQKGRGQASMTMTVALSSIGSSTVADTEMDLQLSGPAAQYGRGMVSDVTSVLMGQFATNLKNRLAAIERGDDPSQVGRAAPASAFSIALQAARMALARVFRRFFVPYQPNQS